MAFCEGGGFACREKGARGCEVFVDKTDELASPSLQKTAEDEADGEERETTAGLMSQSRGWDSCTTVVASKPSTDKLEAFSMTVDERSCETGESAVV